MKKIFGNIFFVTQILVVLATFVLAVMYFFNAKYFKVFEFMVGISFFFMFLNNMILKRRSFITYLYLFFSIVFIVIFIFMLV